MPRPIPRSLVLTHPDGTKVPYGSRFYKWKYQGNDKWDALFKALGYTDDDRESRRWVGEKSQLVLQLHHKGFTVKQISDDTEISNNSVRRILAKNWLTPNSPRGESHLVPSLHHEGLTVKQISDKSGVSKTQVRRILDSNGLTPNVADRSALQSEHQANPLTRWAETVRPDRHPCPRCGSPKPLRVARTVRNNKVWWAWRINCSLGHPKVLSSGGPLTPEHAAEAQRIYGKMQRAKRAN